MYSGAHCGDWYAVCVSVMIPPAIAAEQKKEKARQQRLMKQRRKKARGGRAVLATQYSAAVASVASTAVVARTWDETPESLDINPATGLPMYGGVDAAGNPYGSHLNDQTFSIDSYDHMDSGCSFDSSDSFSSCDSFDSFDSFDSDF